MGCGMSRYADDSDSDYDFKCQGPARRYKTDYYRPEIRPSRNYDGGYGGPRRRHRSSMEFSHSHRRGNDLYFSPQW